mmetsp:Transcript_9290/g.27284  ORF Transcript_9290/g.27284 Transcript_9290/m.27284 type:complete len:300 (-) Transcript_9290:1511-2410(-)
MMSTSTTLNSSPPMVVSVASWMTPSMSWSVTHFVAAPHLRKENRVTCMMLASSSQMSTRCFGRGRCAAALCSVSPPPTTIFTARADTASVLGSDAGVGTRSLRHVLPLVMRLLSAVGASAASFAASISLTTGVGVLSALIMPDLGERAAPGGRTLKGAPGSTVVRLASRGMAKTKRAPSVMNLFWEASHDVMSWRPRWPCRASAITDDRCMPNPDEANPCGALPSAAWKSWKSWPVFSSLRPNPGPLSSTVISAIKFESFISVSTSEPRGSAQLPPGTMPRGESSSVYREGEGGVFSAE